MNPGAPRPVGGVVPRSPRGGRLAPCAAMADPGQLAQMAQLLQQTTAPNTQTMKAATEQLRAAEVTPGFGLVLLQLLQGASVDDATRQAGAIYFKNYVKRQWTVEGPSGSPMGGISDSDRQAIKQHLLTLMLQAPRPVQVQLAAGLEEISITDYPDEWPNLLPEIANHLETSQDINVLKGTMETAHTVFLKFRSQARSNQLLKEIKYTVEGFQTTHLKVFKATLQRVLAGLPPDQLKTHFELLNATIGAFYSLQVVDLPEFFEDHREEYFTGFIELLKYSNDAVSGSGDQQGLLEQVKGGICESMALYTDKYQEEFQPYLQGCVGTVWTLLISLDQQEKNDRLVSKGILFLSSAAATRWEAGNNPFDDPSVLSGICEKVVFPNILLRDSDIELFEDNPLEYVRRDMEAADQDTRRRSSMDLVKAMGVLNEAKVTEILKSYVVALMEQARQVPAERSERFKDACIYLCIAMAVKGQTQKSGVTVTNQNVNLVDFFGALVSPELVAEPITQNSVLRASALKFVTVFRNQLPRDLIGNVLPAICRHTQSPSPVVHTYAAICVEKLIGVRDRPNPQGPSCLRYDPASMHTCLLPMIEPILRIIVEEQGISQNEYLMRAVSRIFAFLRQHGAEVGLRVLQPLATLLIALAANPMNPVFNHNLFEAIASIVKVCATSQPDQVEAALLPAFGQILEKNVTDFLPYTFQILGLLLDASPSPKPLYQELFSRLLSPHLWSAVANVPGLIRLFRAYFAKHQVFMALLQANMQTILERFQFVLCNKKSEAAAFELLNAMYGQLPFELYQSLFKTLMTVLLSRLQSTKSGKFKKDFVISCSFFVHRHPNAATLPGVLREIQPGLLANLVTHVWVPCLKMQMTFDERKVCTAGLTKIMSDEEVRQNPAVLNACCVSLISLLGLSPSTNARVDEEGTDDEAAADGGAGLDYEVSFSRLRNTDLPGGTGGLAADIPDLHASCKQLLLPFAQVIVQLCTANPELEPLARFLR